MYTSRFEHKNFSSKNKHKYIFFLFLFIFISVFSYFVIRYCPYSESIYCDSNYVCSIETKYLFSNQINKFKISKKTNLDYKLSISKSIKHTNNTKTYSLYLFFKDENNQKINLFSNSLCNTSSREKCKDIYMSILHDFNIYKFNPSKGFFKKSKDGIILILMDALFIIVFLAIIITDLRKKL